MNTLIIQNLTKRYPNGVKAMNGISLELTNGMFGLLGPNGAGKSSLMRSLATLQQPDSGSITFNGIDILRNPVFMRQNLGYLPQEFGVYPAVSALRLLEHLAVLKGITNTKLRDAQIMGLLEQTNLVEHRNKAVHTFSGGMRQRFGIAQALLGDPKIIIVDEPTAGLDPEERNRFNTMLCEIGEQRIVILSTHLVEDVSDLCTNMAIMDSGNVLSHGKPSELISQIHGMVWAKEVSKSEAATYAGKHQVISQKLHSGKIKIHIIATQKPDVGFETRSPQLEDVYFKTLLNYGNETV